MPTKRREIIDPFMAAWHSLGDGEGIQATSSLNSFNDALWAPRDVRAWELVGTDYYASNSLADLALSATSVPLVEISPVLESVAPDHAATIGTWLLQHSELAEVGTAVDHGVTDEFGSPATEAEGYTGYSEASIGISEYGGEAIGSSEAGAASDGI